MTEGFLKKIKDAVIGNTGSEQQNSDVDRTQVQDTETQGQFGNIRPASEDPYGDPADQENGGQFGNIRPASEDPYGDPADQENS
jgi:hypothetical protein